MGRSRNLNPSQATLRNFLVMHLLFFDSNGETRREQRGKFGVYRARRDGRSIVRSQILSFPAKTECQITRRHAVVVSDGRPTRRHRTPAADHDPRGLVPRLADIGSGGRIWPASALLLGDLCPSQRRDARRGNQPLWVAQPEDAGDRWAGHHAPFDSAAEHLRVDGV